ncbi:hypothetical protein A2U01_0029421 [Trifolium medium]|uniref:Uncharacterized protein n=1 Tax=Trifolium medium TaxID=97028 RepID=A0A392PBT9_9FABA|nr:hypothetical protein [Trifolium medium]
MALYDILQLDGIVPVPRSSKVGVTYNQNQVIEAIKKHHFGGQIAILPEFHCNAKLRGTPDQLREIRMCLNHNADYINCTNSGNCATMFYWYT